MQIIVANGTLYTKTPGTASMTTRSLPSGVTLKTPRPCHVRLRRASYINGRFSPDLVYRDDLDAFYKTGFTTPTVAPTLATGGAGQLTGKVIIYYTWIHKDGLGNVIAESGPSAPSGELSLANQQWTGTLPTSAPEARTTHKRVYASWNGADPRFIADVLLATATLTSNLRPLEWGAVMETAGGPIPYCVLNEMFRQRVWRAGDADHPDRIYWSGFANGESVGPNAYLLTTSGEAVTGLKRLGETLVVFTINTIDIIVGKTPKTFEILPKYTNVGCISHHSIVNIHDRLWFASQSGLCVYDGSLKYLMDNLRQYWKDDYAADPDAYENSFAEVDFDEMCYLLTLDKSTTFRYVGYYLPFEPQVGGGEGQPWWFFDRETRKTTAMGRLTYSATSARTKLYVGADDGYIREMNVVTDADDDGDVYQKALTIQTKHYLFQDPGGDAESGKQLINLWSYVEAENNGWRLQIKGGDESAENKTVSVWKDDKAASLKVESGQQWVAQTVHVHDGVEENVGRGFTFVYTATAPVGMKWRGVGGSWTLGATSRGRVV